MLEEYNKAYKLGKKDYQARMMRGEKPTLKVLDEILPERGAYSEMPLGLVQIPIDQIVGTKTEGRSSAFAGNFMPILRENTEFAHKWASLGESHVNEGIREPVKAYEYMNRFYIEEGNKRVSVLKFYDAVSVPGFVTRIIPPRTEEKENRIYYEFIDFYELSKVNYIWFSREGSFARLQKLMGKEPAEVWSDDDKLTFSSVYSRFAMEFEAAGGKKLSATTGDAFLAFITVYGYDNICQKTVSELKKLVNKSWEEFRLLEHDNEIDLKMDPNREKKPLIQRLLTGSRKLKIAFIYAKTPGSSAWTYAHELGRLHLEQTFPEEVTTLCYENIVPELAEKAIADAIHQGCNMIFTTTPAFVQASVQAAIANPDIRILNCSLNTSHRYIRTYYARMHEAKFLMGAIAGAMSENGKLAYIADYPIFGTIANINAFALGAAMINPRAKVYLEWSSLKDDDLGKVMERIREKDISVVSGRDMVIPEDASRYFGLYRMENEMPHNLAMPLWHWGKFYEELIRAVMNGAWKYDDSSAEKKAINYWWGMSSEVVDVICSQSLPIGTQRLVELLKETIRRGEFNPFSGVLYSQNGIIREETGGSLSPEEIITMDWLAKNVEGSIPKTWQLNEQAKPVTLQQGVEKEI
nr:BMP family ABC transporter substrate-binding protein [uncultured Blautia sp.]